jgi:anti-sigma B factor antagonist
MMAILEERTDRSILEVEGTLRAPVTSELSQGVQTLLVRGERRILLDLSRLSAIDAAGVGELVRAFNTARAAGGVLRIAHASRRVRQLLHIAGVLGLLTAGADAQLEITGR